MSSASLAAFAVGAALAARVVRQTQDDGEVWPHRVTLALAANLLVQAAFLGVWWSVAGHPSNDATQLLIALSALAMGIQTAAISSLAVRGVFTTAATATVAFFMGDLAGWSQPRGERARLAAVVVGLVAGALIGGVLVVHAVTWAPLFPLAMTALVVTTAALSFRTPGHVRAPADGMGDRHETPAVSGGEAMPTTASRSPHGTTAGSPELTDGFNLVVDALRLNGVDTIYGVVGIPITDVARTAQDKGMRYIGFRNEQAAGHAAGAAGFLTQRPGICLTVSAPGFLNGLAALANATTNCFPMIQISGSSDRAIVDLQQGDYEELDQMAVARQLAKAAYRVERPEDIGVGVARAIRTAVSERPGGVYLDLPASVLSATLEAQAGRDSLIEVVDPSPGQLAAPDAIDRALDLLAGADRPLIVIGKGAAYARAENEIRRFVEATGIPFLPMSMAKGLLPDDHPQSVAAARSLALGGADVVMLVGARLNWLLGHGRQPQWAKDCRFVQVDISAQEIDSNQAIAAPLVGDIKSVVTQLLAALQPGQASIPSRAWLDQLEARKAHNTKKMAARLAVDTVPMNFSVALRAIRDVLAEHPGTYVVNEGANTLDFGRDILSMSSPRHRLDPGTWGVMGVGMGYAIAAAVESGKPVVAVEGDSAFGFSGMELETICRYQLPIVTVILNNGGVYKGDEGSHQTSDPAPTRLSQSSRYEQLIEAFGGQGYLADDADSLTAAMQKALGDAKPAVINCLIDPTAGTESGHLQNLNADRSASPTT